MLVMIILRQLGNIECFNLIYPNIFSSNFQFRILGFLQDIQVDNLNEFVVDNIDFSLLRLKLDFGFTLPKTVMTGLYNVTGEYLNRIKLWGNGPFSVELNGESKSFPYYSTLSKLSSL